MNNKWQNAVRNMEQRMESLRLNMHGYQILYRGELIGERYWEPFHRDSLHRMYSITKSFTSLATGLLAAEGKCTHNDHRQKTQRQYLFGNCEKWPFFPFYFRFLVLCLLHAYHICLSVKDFITFVPSRKRLSIFSVKLL